MLIPYFKQVSMNTIFHGKKMIMHSLHSIPWKNFNTTIYLHWIDTTNKRKIRNVTNTGEYGIVFILNIL